MYIQCDASQLEWRTALELSQDQVGIDEVINGEDTHAKNQAAFVLPSRLIAKIFLFRTIFRGSGWSFANDPDFMHVSTSSEFWEDMNAKFYKKYHGLAQTHVDWASLVMEGKPIVSPLGRHWQIAMGKDYKGNTKIPWTVLSNYPVQGTGADIMMLARISARNRLAKLKIPHKARLTVHDSIVVDTESKYAEQIKEVFEEVFSDLPSNIYKVFGYSWKVPLACECKFGLNLRDMKKFS
jgi:DNA polymerase-1